MRVLVEVTEQNESLTDDGDAIYEKKTGWLCHWGVEYSFFEVKGEYIPVYYTVAIVQDYNTGDVNTYRPAQIRILGKEIKT